jgi:hypothetical protein
MAFSSRRCNLGSALTSGEHALGLKWQTKQQFFVAGSNGIDGASHRICECGRNRDNAALADTAHA